MTLAEPLMDNNEKNIVLSYADSLQGYVQLSAGIRDENPKVISIPYIIKGRDDVAITVSYRTFDKKTNIVQKRTEQITLKAIPQTFALHHNYPNPFNPTTSINFDLPNNTNVTIAVYDINGRLVANLFKGVKSAGYHTISWDSRNQLGGKVSAGVYFYQLQSKEFVKTRKMILLK